MSQSYKNIYFRDLQRPNGRSSLTLAFGAGDRDVFRAVRPLSSDTLRRVLGYDSFAALQRDAEASGRSVNALALWILREHLRKCDSVGTGQLPGLGGDHPFAIDAIQATYRGGHREPLHAWYPLLEGYSPAFVEAVLQRYSPHAESVFDPFAGTGTTPLTAAKLGKRALFCEVNPVLQFIVSVKAEIVQMRKAARISLAKRVLELAGSFQNRMQEAAPDEGLRRAYASTFGESVFFDKGAFDAVLRCRSVIDETHTLDPQTARLMTVAVLRSLVSASRLIRRGDVRYMTEAELARGGPVDLSEEVTGGMEMLARDVCDIGSMASHPPTLLLENAKNLDLLPNLALDSAITSPPYLNGTNYFRNTKLELWFLRRLTCPSDLARFRFDALTAGINDVTVAKSAGTLPPSATAVVDELQANAYDARIPRMVECFASETHAILRALARRMHKRGVIAIDIGDSAYAGVKVPTDKFIAESLESGGFDLVDQVVLRERRSRSQMQLTQRLLVFQRGSPPRYRRRGVLNGKEHWHPAWESFKKTLPHQAGAFAKRNWGHPLHSLCSYQGKMKPSLAAHLVQTFVQPGGRMLDPFSGVGTLAFEASLNGVEAWAFDISPPAVHITAGKVERADTASCKALVQRLGDYIIENKPTKAEFASAASIRFNGPLPSYFHPKTLNEILLARRFFQQHSPSNGSESLVLASLLHILHGNRPYALSRRSHPITPFAPTGPTEYRALIPRLLDKVERSVATPLPNHFVAGHAAEQDVTEWWPASVQDLDAVVTSPPFFASTRFHAGNWMRLWFTGWEAEDFRVQPASFVDERQKRGFNVYEPVFRQCRERLKRSGVVVLHLGGSRKCDMAEELSRVARPWFQVADTYVESVAHCERHGIRDKGTTASHQYLVLH